MEPTHLMHLAPFDEVSRQSGFTPEYIRLKLLNRFKDDRGMFNADFGQRWLFQSDIRPSFQKQDWIRYARQAIPVALELWSQQNGTTNQSVKASGRVGESILDYAYTELNKRSLLLNNNAKYISVLNETHMRLFQIYLTEELESVNQYLTNYRWGISGGKREEVFGDLMEWTCYYMLVPVSYTHLTLPTKA